MKSSTKWVIAILVLVVIIILFWSSRADVAGEYDLFAQCLTDSGAKMYGVYWCSHCAEQKEMFGKSFEFVNYIECDSRGDDANPEACDAAGIQGYPTWIFEDGSRVARTIPLRELSLRTGCALE